MVAGWGKHVADRCISVGNQVEPGEWCLTAPPKQGGTPRNNFNVKRIMISKYIWPLETQSGPKTGKKKTSFAVNMNQYEQNMTE